MSQSSLVRRKINREMTKIQLMENNVVANHEVLQESTTSPETLQVIESRQYRERGLLHISDAAYSFFLLLEQERVDRINFFKLAALQKDMVDTSIKEVLWNKSLFLHFKNVISLEGTADKVRTIIIIFFQRILGFG